MHRFLLSSFCRLPACWLVSSSFGWGNGLVRRIMTVSVPGKLWGKKIRSWQFGWLIPIWIRYLPCLQVPMSFGKTVLTVTNCGKKGKPNRNNPAVAGEISVFFSIRLLVCRRVCAFVYKLRRKGFCTLLKCLFPSFLFCTFVYAFGGL